MNDDRLTRREARLAALSALGDEELKTRFWALADDVVAPLVELARTHTTPSIERSVLLRMGVDSITAQAVVTTIHRAGLLGKGAGGVVLRLARRDGIDVRAAATLIARDATVLDGLYERAAAR
jgi:D-ornithine 4,5-aminomutase subunit alpha